MDYAGGFLVDGFVEDLAAEEGALAYGGWLVGDFRWEGIGVVDEMVK